MEQGAAKIEPPVDERRRRVPDGPSLVAVDVPDPELAQQVADALTRLGDLTERSSWDVTGTLLGITRHWEGRAASAAEALLREVGQTGAQTADAVHDAASTWTKLAGDLRSVETKIRFVGDISKDR